MYIGYSKITTISENFHDAFEHPIKEERENIEQKNFSANKSLQSIRNFCILQTGKKYRISLHFLQIYGVH